LYTDDTDDTEKPLKIRSFSVFSVKSVYQKGLITAIPNEPNMQESPIFTRTFDLLAWLIPALQKFPKEQRFVLAARVNTAAFNFYEAITAASLSKKKAEYLEQADVELQKLRLYLRLSHRLQFLSNAQYKHVFELVEEVGRLLGGWSKKLA
jgi:four helix bundle protein